MPIFHDLHDSTPRRFSSRHMSPGGRRRAKGPDLSAPTSRLHGLQPWDDSFRGAQPMVNSELQQSVQMKQNSELQRSGQMKHNFDRMDLIERLKRTKSPVWLQDQNSEGKNDHSPERQPDPQDMSNVPLSPSPEHDPQPALTPDPLRDLAGVGLEIERPRSALHSGDFRERKEDITFVHGSSAAPFRATSPVPPWNRLFPAAGRPLQDESTCAFDRTLGEEPRAVSRARAMSQSSTRSFTLLPPTSPLVQQANNTDLDFPSKPGSRQASRSPDHNNRRHTFSPASFQTHKTMPTSRSTSGTPAARHFRSGSSIPYQAHQPRRSITMVQSHSQSSPQTPFLSPRRPSFSSEASPLQHAPMVGSYEESILRGRMSTTPSRPLDFVAKIGVLGKGQCKSSLKCPPHVTVPFPAVFYSYNTGNGRIGDNEPSPYVGLIDLEHSLLPPDESSENAKRKCRHAVPAPDHDDLDFRISRAAAGSDLDVKNDLHKKEKRKRRVTSSKAPPGGSYRIPAKGQLQIVLKNPNNTAVKLFLVPYDLSDMEPGQKTFIRQRSYSAGPIIDMPTSSRKNFGTDRPEAALSNSEDPNDRPILRYLVHLHMCCPSKDRFYLYKSIRVVFANRVPDGKEKLRNEIQLPEPRYSAYKPARDFSALYAGSPAGLQLTTEKTFRRRSAAWPLSRSQQTYDHVDGIGQRPPLPPPAVQFTGPLSSSTSSSYNPPMPGLQAIPFSFHRLAAIESRPVSRDHMDIDNKSPCETPIASSISDTAGPMTQRGTFGKLHKGDIGYGGNAFSPLSSPTSTQNTGLLSQRLRGLEFQRETEDES